MVGDGPDKKELVKYSNGLKNIIFKDSVPKKDIPNLLKDANAIILLFGVKLFTYGAPNKLYDAYAYRPVITNIPGDINDEANNNRIGFTADSDNHKNLPRRKNYFTNKERIRMSNRARKLVENKNQEKVINKYNSLLRINLMKVIYKIEYQIYVWLLEQMDL